MKKLILSLVLLVPVMAFAQETNAKSDSVDTEVMEMKAVEEMPGYPGGKEALLKFLRENVHYPKAAEKAKAEGRVICQFVVNKDGSIDDVHVVRSGGHVALDMEAVRVLKLMPKWKPGKAGGEPVRVRYTVPVNFRL